MIRFLIDITRIICALGNTEIRFKKDIASHLNERFPHIHIYECQQMFFLHEFIFLIVFIQTILTDNEYYIKMWKNISQIRLTFFKEIFKK